MSINIYEQQGGDGQYGQQQQGYGENQDQQQGADGQYGQQQQGYDENQDQQQGGPNGDYDQQQYGNGGEEQQNGQYGQGEGEQDGQDGQQGYGGEEGENEQQEGEEGEEGENETQGQQGEEEPEEGQEGEEQQQEPEEEQEGQEPEDEEEAGPVQRGGGVGSANRDFHQDGHHGALMRALDGVAGQGWTNAHTDSLLHVAGYGLAWAAKNTGMTAKHVTPPAGAKKAFPGIGERGRIGVETWPGLGGNVPKPPGVTAGKTAKPAAGKTAIKSTGKAAVGAAAGKTTKPVTGSKAVGAATAKTGAAAANKSGTAAASKAGGPAAPKGVNGAVAKPPTGSKAPPVGVHPGKAAPKTTPNAIEQDAQGQRNHLSVKPIGTGAHRPATEGQFNFPSEKAPKAAAGGAAAHPAHNSAVPPMVALRHIK